MQRVQNRARLCLRADQKIESGERAIDEGVGNRSSGRGSAGGWRGSRLGVEERALIRFQSEISTAQIGLYTIAQLVIECDLCDGRIDCNLQLRLIYLLQCRFDEPVIFLVRIDQQGVVDGIGRDLLALQNRLAAAARTSAVQ